MNASCRMMGRVHRLLVMSWERQRRCLLKRCVHHIHLFTILFSAVSLHSTSLNTWTKPFSTPTLTPKTLTLPGTILGLSPNSVPIKSVGLDGYVSYHAKPGSGAPRTKDTLVLLGYALRRSKTVCTTPRTFS